MLLPLEATQVAATASNLSSNSTAAIISKAKIPTINNSLVVAQSPFYESKVWKLIGQVAHQNAVWKFATTAGPATEVVFRQTICV